MIFNIQNSSVGSAAPEGSAFISGSLVISGGMAAHQGQPASRCGERRPDSGSSV